MRRVSWVRGLCLASAVASLVGAPGARGTPLDEARVDYYVAGAAGLDRRPGDEVVLVAVQPDRGTWSVAAHDGASGVTIWSASFLGGPHTHRHAAVQIVDVAGDAHPEVIVVASSGALAQQISVLDGADGSVRWQRTFGATAISPVELCLSVAAVEDIEDVRPMPDADGDGRSDVFVATSTGTCSGTAIATATALSGQSGEVVGSFRLAPNGGSFIPVRDVSGDREADVIAWQAGDGVLSTRSVTGTVYWSRPGLMPWDEVELDGDAGAEIRAAVLAQPGVVAGVDGSRGSTLWRTSAPPVGRPLADVNGDGIDDLVTTACREPVGPTVVRARSGSSLRTLWRWVSAETVCRSQAAELVGDVTGDGAPDVIVAVRLRTPSSQQTRWLYVIDGRRGTTQYRKQGWGYFVLPGSLHGSGAELVTVQQRDGALVTVYDGTDGRLLWRTTLLTRATRVGEPEIAVVRVAGGQPPVLVIGLNFIDLDQPATCRAFGVSAGRVRWRLPHGC